MKKQIIVLASIIVILVVLFLSFRSIKAPEPYSGKDVSVSLPEIVPPSLDTSPKKMLPLSERAWDTLQKYLAFAKSHNLAGLRSLSHQISDTCNDPPKEKECFALMDGVYGIASSLELGAFKHIQSDERQIIMYTDGPTVAILFFTRGENDAIKVLGIRFCAEDETTKETCVETDIAKRDLDGNGWWDSVESLFYTN